jgi:hypothetical protein
MPERDANDSLAAESGAPHTPRVSGQQPAGASALEAPPPASGTQHAAPPEEPVASEPSDTLLSAGKPADRLELLLEDRMAAVDDRLRELDARLAVLEQKKSVHADPAPRQKPWLWLVFLIGLVVIFQLLRRVQ